MQTIVSPAVLLFQTAFVFCYNTAPTQSKILDGSHRFRSVPDRLPEIQESCGCRWSLRLSGKWTEDPQHGTASPVTVDGFQSWHSSIRSFSTASIPDSQSRCRVQERPHGE